MRAIEAGWAVPRLSEGFVAAVLVRCLSPLMGVNAAWVPNKAPRLLVLHI